MIYVILIETPINLTANLFNHIRNHIIHLHLPNHALRSARKE